MKLLIPALLFGLLAGVGMLSMKRKTPHGAAHLSPGKKDKLVVWKETRSLMWSDFSGKARRESVYDSWTWSGINYTYSCDTTEERVRVVLNAYAFFDPHRSWVRKGEETPGLLAHEQLHFDISEMHCRCFERAVCDFAFTDNVKTEIDSIFAVCLDKLLAAQVQYDEESQHCLNKAGQAKWEQYVAGELKRVE